ncbi:GGDEF domain-containing protein [Rhodanobacter sp. 7MK24]|uniref:GGDEF domain-containing protein n=1 Tax=Rhodanobacter sp. 7MK24 TaxID=2775922 RepID=UPI00178631AF|nr:GGDEF domain-containing protein [Rhodanobacter sp. 7MK24]MBD8880122.1 GGDEF domain-containing protein [Rhodanobacter sp. 7MK24]
MTASHGQTGLRYALALASLPALLACGLLIAPLQVDHWSYHLQFVIALATTIWCVRLVFRSSYPRTLILALAISLGLWTLGVATLLVQIDLLHSLVDMTNYTYLLFVGYGVPLLYVAVAFGDPYSSRWQKMLDASLLVLLGLLYWVSIVDVLDAHGSLSPTSLWYVRHALDAVNVFLAVAHVARWLTASSVASRRFFRITSVYLVGYVVCIGIHNHADMESVGVSFMSILGDVLPPVPFIALALMLHHWRNAPSEAAASGSGVLQRIALGVSPILFLLAIFAVGLSIDDRRTGQVLLIVGLAMAAYILRTVHVQYHYVQAQDRLQGMTRALERLSYTDAVTDLPNRRAFDHAFVREWAASARVPDGMSLLMIDIDRFKDYNDLYGHQAGDHCLRTVARLIAGTLHRPADFCGRYGGEEFVILLPGTQLAGAEVVACRILERIHTANLPYATGIDGRVTVSIGVSARNATDVQAESLMERADRNLYRAKGRGRDQWDASDTGL